MSSNFASGGKPIAPSESDGATASAARRVARIEESGIFPATAVFHSAPLSFRDLPPFATAARRVRRVAWLGAALDVTAGADVVFMDPDNGFACRSASPSSKKGPKYVFDDELQAFVERGQSVIIYHHQTRERGGLDLAIESRLEALRSLAPNIEPWALVLPPSIGSRVLCDPRASA